MPKKFKYKLFNILQSILIQFIKIYKHTINTNIQCVGTTAGNNCNIRIEIEKPADGKQKKLN